MTETLVSELNNYVLEKELGRDDWTIVYQGRRKSDGATVNIKIVAPQFTFDEFFVRRFKDAAKQAAKLEHPNIVRTYEVEQENGTLYLVRELIDARPLAQVLEDEGPFSPQRMLIIARQIASALDYAHQKSVTHGDLSTNRVYIGPNDNALVADFGQMPAMIGSSLVKQGYAVGSPETTAPERVHGQGPSRQSDLYSLGILCYQMLVGKPPFTGAPAAILHAQAYEQPRPLHLVNPGISVRLSEAIGRMLSKGLELRYNTGAEFARAISVAAEGTAPMRAPAAAFTEKKEAGLLALPIWKRTWFWAIIAVLLIIVLSVLGFWVVSAWSSQVADVSTQNQAVVQSTLSPDPSISPAETEASAKPAVVASPADTVAVGGDSSTPTTTLVDTPIPTSMPAQAPISIALPTPGPPVVAEDSPFTNLRVAHNISEANQPQDVGMAFSPGSQPIYLFFDYDQTEPGMVWSHRWTWGDTELGFFEEVWPASYQEKGTAWIYFSPAGGYQPGPYKITLEVNGQIVATATFIIQAGGL